MFIVSSHLHTPITHYLIYCTSNTYVHSSLSIPTINYDCENNFPVHIIIFLLSKLSYIGEEKYC